LQWINGITLWISAAVDPVVKEDALAIPAGGWDAGIEKSYVSPRLWTAVETEDACTANLPVSFGGPAETGVQKNPSYANA
jgi:hypothetical protein